jgi:hypothetical protein
MSESNDIVALLENLLSEGAPNRWAKLSSDIQYRRLNLLLLKEILSELRRLNERLERANVISSK